MDEHELTIDRLGWWRGWFAGCTCSGWTGCREHTRRRAIRHHTVHLAQHAHILL